MSDTRESTTTHFRAMGSEVTIVLTGRHPESTLDTLRRRVEHIESLWSRFRPDSEISRLNRARGREVIVSAETAELITFMIQAFRASDGRFDPTMLNDVIRIGYARSMEQHSVHAPSTITFDFDTRGALEETLITPLDGSFGVTLSPGTVLDPGGLKGLAADMVLREVLDAGVPGALVSIGGDIAVGGESPDTVNECWTIRVLDPFARDDLSYVRVAAGGVATSSSMLRRFGSRNERHHLVDPRTHDSTANQVFGATVVAGSAAWAEVFAKVLMIDGRDALAHLDERGLAGLVIDLDGVVANTSYSRFETHTSTKCVA